MATIYLPVEVSRREVVARAFLAARLAAEGHDVLVFRADLFDRVGWPGPGIYIGKNFLNPSPPHDLTLYKRLKRAGIRAWLLDEEGGIYSGETEEEWKQGLALRYDPTVLAPDDKMLAWGEWQKDYLDTKGAAAPVEVVGSANFDIYQPRHHPTLADFDREQTEGMSGYILVNTRFAFVNALNNGPTHFIHHGLITKIFDEPDRFRRLSAEGIIFYRFVHLVYEVARGFPDRTIVLRPHPVEDPAVYERLFAPVRNVIIRGEGDAGAWIRRSQCLVHNGCTTAIQAAIAGKPVITYAPDAEDAGLVAGLPNRVGGRARTIEEAVAMIAHGAPSNDRGEWKRTISVLDSIDRMAVMVAQEPDLPAAAPLAAAKRLARRFDLTEMPRIAARPFFPQRGANARKIEAKFDRGFFAKLPEIAQAAAHEYQAPITAQRLSRYCYAVSPRR